MSDKIVAYSIDFQRQPIYKASKLHRSMARNDLYLKCDHYCVTCHRGWLHRIGYAQTDWTCTMFFFRQCEECMCWPQTTNEEKFAKLSPEWQRVQKERYGRIT